MLSHKYHLLLFRCYSIVDRQLYRSGIESAKSQMTSVTWYRTCSLACKQNWKSSEWILEQGFLDECCWWQCAVQMSTKDCQAIIMFSSWVRIWIDCSASQTHRSSSLPLAKALHWLPVEQLAQYKIAVMTCKVRLHQQPLYLREYIDDHLPTRSLRSTNKMLLTTITTKTETAARAFRAAAPKIWNSLPVIVKTAMLKGHLLSHAFEWSP